jgi:flagellar hook-associated protein 1 FlgK
VANLFSMLGSSARALEAQRFGLDVAGQNIGNLNTPGYARRVANLASLAPMDRWSAGGGVTATGLQAIRDGFLAQRLRAEVSRAAGHDASAQLLGVAEVGLGAPGASIDARLEDLFDAFAAVADDPVSLAARRTAIEAGAALASTFRDVSASLRAAAGEADTRLRAAAGSVNGLAARVAALNESLSATPAGDARVEHLRDELGLALEQLAQLVDVRVVTRGDGGVDVELAGGVALVLGGTAGNVTVAAQADGAVSLTLDGYALGPAAGGMVGALVRARDEILPRHMADLDALAHSVASAINDQHAAGFDLGGTRGDAFFVPPGDVAGASSRLAMSAVLSATGGEARLAASASGAAGDNENARRLLGIRDLRVALGGTATPGDAWSAIASGLGAEVASARAAAESGADAVTQLLNLRDSVSGVSLDEEAATLMRFQRGYEANARVFRAIDDVLDVLMGLVRG